MREFPKFARRLKWVCPNRKWPCSRKNGRGTVKREAPISARPVAFAASEHVVNPALNEQQASIFFKCDVWGDNNNFWCRTGVTYLNAVFLGTKISNL